MCLDHVRCFMCLRSFLLLSIMSIISLPQDFAAEVISIKGLETDEYELVCIRNVDILARW